MKNILTHRWTVMTVWLVSGVSAFMMAIVVGILMPSIRAELGLSPAQQGFLGSSAFVGNLILAIPLSWWTSQFRPKPLTAVTLVIGAALLAFQGWAPNFAVLLIGRLGFGVSTLAREPARALLMQQWFQPREFIIVNSMYNALFGLVVGGGLATTPFILDAAGDDWRMVLFAFVGLALLMALLWTAIGRERADARAASRESGGRLEIIGRVLSRRDLWTAGLGFTGATLGWSAFLNFYPTLMLDEYGVPLTWTGAILGLGILIGGVCGIAFGYAIIGMSPARRKNLVQALGVLMAATYLAMIRLDAPLPLLALASAANGVAWGFWPILSSVPFYLPGIRPREVAVAVSLIMTTATFGTFLGPSIAGALQERLGDLRTALTIVCFAPLSLTVAGTLLRIRAGEDSGGDG